MPRAVGPRFRQDSAAAELAKSPSSARDVSPGGAQLGTSGYSGGSGSSNATDLPLGVVGLDVTPREPAGLAPLEAPPPPSLLCWRRSSATPRTTA